MNKNKNTKINENFKNIEKLIIDIKDNINKKLEENINIINILKKKIEKDRISIENNNKKINVLKNEINFFKNELIILKIILILKILNFQMI